MDEESGASILLLEDLSALRPGDAVGGCRFEDAALAVEQIARFHAQWWEHPRLGGFWWMPVSGSDPDALMETFRRCWEPFLANWGEVTPAALRSIGEEYASGGAGTWKKLGEPPHTIAHGDFRLDNLLFDASSADQPLAIIDWQVAVRGRGVSDVAYLAAFCLPAEHRRAWEQQLVQLYHTTLVRNGVRGYNLLRCHSDYRLGAFQVLHRAVVAGAMLDFGSTRGRELMAAVLTRCSAFLEDHNARRILFASLQT